MTEYKMVALDKLIPYARNAKVHSEAQISKVAASIKEFGFLNPILIDKDNSVMAGHCRLLSAKKLNLSEVPCLRIEHLTEPQKKAYIIADNKLAELADWDIEMLGLELEELNLEEFDLDLTGFSNLEIEGLLNNDDEAFDFKEPSEKSDEEKLEIKVMVESLCEKEELFMELKNRGFKVKAS